MIHIVQLELVKVGIKELLQYQIPFFPLPNTYLNQAANTLKLFFKTVEKSPMVLDSKNISVFLVKIERNA